MKIKKMFDQIQKENIVDLETKLKCKLPEDYNLFLMEYNGGIPSSNIFLISEQEGEDKLSILYGITDNKNNDIWSNYILNMDDRSLLPIGADPGGSFICMKIKAEPTGGIYFFDHETNNPIQIEKDFTSFISSLYEETKF